MMMMMMMTVAFVRLSPNFTANCCFRPCPAAGRTSYPEGRDRSPRRSPPRTAFSVRTVASTQATQATQVYSWETQPQLFFSQMAVYDYDSDGLKMALQGGLEIWGTKVGLYRAYTNHCMRVLLSPWPCFFLVFRWYDWKTHFFLSGITSTSATGLACYWCVFFAHKASSKTSGEMSSLGHTDCLCPYPLGDLIWPISMLLHPLHVLLLVNVPDTESSVDEPSIHASGRIDDVEIAPRVRRSR